MNLRVSEYVVNQLAEWGVSHAFTLTGGGAMFLNDAFGHHDKIKMVYQHHEQACAMAAEGFARIANAPGVCVVTTGPGGINALNGVFGAWTDSIPMLVISGQVKRETSLAANPIAHLRQLGDQEVEIVKMASPITKYSSVLLSPEDVAYELEKAWHLATHGRKGPVWLDIPIDVQSSFIDPEQLNHFDTGLNDAGDQSTEAALEAQCSDIIARIMAAKSPVILAGSGVRLGGALDEFSELIDALQIPVTTAWTHDLVPSDHPLFCGRPGTIGTRAGNFVVQNADLLLVIGSRLNIRQTSYNYENFASKAFVIQVDIDAVEMSKPTYRPNLGICCDARQFCAELTRQARLAQIAGDKHRDWLDWSRRRSTLYPVVLPHHLDANRPINSYHFVNQLFEQSKVNDVIVTGNATACIVPFQVAKLKKGQRLFSNSGSASMGYDLPASIGAYFGTQSRGKKPSRVICLAGDGSIMLNAQELQTVASLNIPVKIIILNNDGYLSIRGSQMNFFGRKTGESQHSGVGFPDFLKLADACGLPATRLSKSDFAKDLKIFLDASGPGVLEVILDPEQGFEPRVSSRELPDGTIVSPALEDMFPFLSKEELKTNSYVPPID